LLKVGVLGNHQVKREEEMETWRHSLDQASKILLLAQLRKIGVGQQVINIFHLLQQVSFTSIGEFTCSDIPWSFKNFTLKLQKFWSLISSFGEIQAKRAYL